jgi:hypothetical protein
MDDWEYDYIALFWHTNKVHELMTMTDTPTWFMDFEMYPPKLHD